MHGHGLERTGAVVDAEPLLEVDGVLAELVLNQEDQLFVLEEGADVQNLEVGAELPPAGVGQIDVVLHGHVLAAAHVVPQVLQLILGKDVLCQNGFFQTFEEIPANNCIFRVDIVPKPPFLRAEGDKPVVVKGIKADGQVREIGKVLAEEIGIALQQLAVFFIPLLLELDVGLIEGLGQDVQAVLRKEPAPVQVQKHGVGHLIISAALEDVERALHGLLRGRGLVEGQLVGLAGVLSLAQGGHSAGDFDGLHR